MSDVRYNLVFSGDIVPGADIEAVKQNLARLFKVDAPRVDAMFSGKDVVLKKDADQATAMKFRAVLKQAGAQCRMVEVGTVQGHAVPTAAPAQTSTPSAPADESAAAIEAPAPPTQTSAASSSGDMDMVGTIRTGGTGFSGEFDVAPAGTDMAEHQEGPPPIVPDVSAMSMAPVGSDMGQLKKDEDTRVPDISHLSVAPAGTTLSDKS